jgi:2-haloacid dehalogenase
VEVRGLLFDAYGTLFGAKAFGFRVAWVNRQGAPAEELGVTPDLEVRDLSQLANALGR